MYKLLIPLLLMSVQGVAQTWKKIPVLEGHESYSVFDHKRNLIIQLCPKDSCDYYQLEIQTLRLLNDSLTKKMQLLLEWQELACPIIENIGVVKTVNGYRLLVNKREMIKPAVRYYKRYKTGE